MNNLIYEIRKQNLIKNIEKRFKSINEFAAVMNIEVAPLYKINNGQLKMGEKAARKYEKLLELELNELDRADSYLLQVRTAYIPLYEIVETASDRDEPGSKIGNISIPSEPLKQKNLTSSDLIAFKVNNNSMAETINYGAYAIVNTKDKLILDGKIYAIRSKSTLIFRRVFKMIEGYMLKADNENFPEEKILNLSNQDIIGKVECVLNIFY